MSLLELGYIGLTLLMTTVLLVGYATTMKRIGMAPTSIRSRIALTGFGIIGWLTYVFILAHSGILKDLSLPPRFPLLLIIPLFIFTGVFLYAKRRSPVLHAIPRSWPIYFQSFRIAVESLFVSTVAIGYLHKEVTIEGYNYDMLFGISAIVIGLLVFQLKVLPKKALLAWNYMGILVLASVIFLFTTTVFFPVLWGYESSFVPTEFLDFPYILVAAYLMPLAVFMHILSIIQLKASSK